MRGGVLLLMTDSCLGNPTDKGGWRATVHGLTESDTTENTHTHTHPPTTENTHTHTHPLPPDALEFSRLITEEGGGAKQQLPGGVQLPSSLLAGD